MSSFVGLINRGSRRCLRSHRGTVIVKGIFGSESTGVTRMRTRNAVPTVVKRMASAPSMPKPPSGAQNFTIFLLFLTSGIVIWYMFSKDAVEVDWVTFKHQYLPGWKGFIKHLELNEKRKTATIYLLDGRRLKMHIGDVDAFVSKLEYAQAELNLDIWDRVPVTYATEGVGGILWSILPSMVILGLFFTVFRYTTSAASEMGGGSGGIFGSVTNSRAKLYNAEMNPRVTFDSVAGLQEAKEEVMEFVHFLKAPEKYSRLGAKIPRGALLVGPPGTGKTLLAKATAGEAGVPFFSAAGSDFSEMFVGVGPARVRDLFAKARQKAPCIIFIDEIDAIGKKRDKSGFGDNDERENTLNQLLVELDGFNTRSGVIILAGTNRADILDKALTRPGRFDRTISIDPPDLKGRKEILQVHLKALKLEEQDKLEQYAEHLATLTPGMVGADLANICNEGALLAARLEKQFVQLSDLEAAIERVIGGLEKKTKILPPRERKIVAYHEAGHAVAGWFSEWANPILKVSIIPRGPGLGYAQYQPSDKYLYTKEQLFHRMCVMLGGRVAEHLTFGSISTGARDDLEKVTQLAYQALSQLGMGKAVGNMSFQEGQTGEMGWQLRPYSAWMSEQIDLEVREFIKQAEERTTQLLLDNRDGLIKVAERLLEREMLNAQDMSELLGERPWKELRSFAELSYDDSKKPVALIAETDKTEEPEKKEETEQTEKKEESEEKTEPEEKKEVEA